MSGSARARPRAVFFGSPDFAVPSLERLLADAVVVGVVTQPDRPSGRGQAVAEPAVKRIARARAPGVPILQPEKIRTGDFEARLRELGADVFVVVAYGRILPQTILDLPPLGPWNVHASLLPRLRGAAPIQWAIINDDARTGVSIMRMEAGLDTGPVAAQVADDIHSDDTAATLAARLARLGADLLGATLPAIAGGTVVVEPQNDAQATLAPILRKEDGRLDFTQASRAVSARARGVDPWPGATALLAGEPLKLFSPRVPDGVPDGSDVRAIGGAPGTVVAIDAAGLWVACADRAIVFAEVQLAGRKRMTASAAAAGRALTTGVQLG